MGISGYFIKLDIEDIEKYSKNIKKNRKQIEKILKKTCKYWEVNHYGHHLDAQTEYLLKDSSAETIIRYNPKNRGMQFSTYDGEKIIKTLRYRINKLRDDLSEENRDLIWLLKDLENHL